MDDSVSRRSSTPQFNIKDAQEQAKKVGRTEGAMEMWIDWIGMKCTRDPVEKIKKAMATADKVFKEFKNNNIRAGIAHLNHMSETQLKAFYAKLDDDTEMKRHVLELLNADGKGLLVSVTERDGEGFRELTNDPSKADPDIKNTGLDEKTAIEAGVRNWRNVAAAVHNITNKLQQNEHFLDAFKSEDDERRSERKPPDASGSLNKKSQTLEGVDRESSRFKSSKLKSPRPAISSSREEEIFKKISVATNITFPPTTVKKVVQLAQTVQKYQREDISDEDLQKIAYTAATGKSKAYSGNAEKLAALTEISHHVSFFYNQLDPKPTEDEQDDLWKFIYENFLIEKAKAEKSELTEKDLAAIHLKADTQIESVADSFITHSGQSSYEAASTDPVEKKPFILDSSTQRSHPAQQREQAPKDSNTRAEEFGLVTGDHVENPEEERAEKVEASLDTKSNSMSLNEAIDIFTRNLLSKKNLKEPDFSDAIHMAVHGLGSKQPQSPVELAAQVVHRKLMEDDFADPKDRFTYLFMKFLVRDQTDTEKEKDPSEGYRLRADSPFEVSFITENEKGTASVDFNPTRGQRSIGFIDVDSHQLIAEAIKIKYYREQI